MLPRRFKSSGGRKGSKQGVSYLNVPDVPKSHRQYDKWKKPDAEEYILFNSI